MAPKYPPIAIFHPHWLGCATTFTSMAPYQATLTTPCHTRWCKGCWKKNLDFWKLLWWDCFSGFKHACRRLVYILFERKVGSIAPSWVQKHLFTISGSRVTSKPIWYIRLQKFYILENLVSLNLILFCLCFGSLVLYRNRVELETCLRMSYLKWDMYQPSKMVIARGIKHRLFIISTSWNLIPHIVLFIPNLPDIVQKCFCTSDGAMDPPLNIKYVPAF